MEAATGSTDSGFSAVPANSSTRDALREACLDLLIQLGHPVHHGMLAGIVRANADLSPRKGQVLYVLGKLLAEGLVERIRAGVYRACLTAGRDEQR